MIDPSLPCPVEGVPLQFGAGVGRLPIQQYAWWWLRGVDSLQVDETITAIDLG
jgi:hypothetical protein